MFPILKATDLSKTYPGNRYPSLINFSLEVNKGDITALLGESGCGKTTALRIIAGFENAEKGTVIVNNSEVANKNTFIEPHDRGVGIVFQDYALFPHKTVWQNIRFGLFKLSRKDQIIAATKVLELTGMENYKSRYPHQLSGGQQQRIALARALAPNPRVLLLDEPFSNIDAMKKNQIREEIKTIIKKADTTAIFVTHDTKDVMAIADKVAVMKEGIILQEGTPAHVYNQPADDYVAHFFGKTNIIKATISNNLADSEIGQLKIQPDMTNGSAYQASLSIRPNAFEISDHSHPDAIPVTIEKSTFMGEYTELSCKTRTPGAPPVNLIVHIHPGQSAPSPDCYLITRPEAINVME